MSRDEALRTVWFVGEVEDAPDELLVEGTLRVIWHRAWGGVPAFAEYRLLDVRP